MISLSWTPTGNPCRAVVSAAQTARPSGRWCVPATRRSCPTVCTSPHPGKWWRSRGGRYDLPRQHHQPWPHRGLPEGHRLYLYRSTDCLDQLRLTMISTLLTSRERYRITSGTTMKTVNDTTMCTHNYANKDSAKRLIRPYES